MIMKNILDKINKAYEVEANKVELGTHQVHLALLDELKVYAKNTAKYAADYKKKSEAIKKSVATLQGLLKDVSVNKDYGKKVLANAEKYKAQMDKLSKELGINLQGSEPDKLLSEVFMLGEDAQGNIDDALSAVRTLKV
jgi:hypothetical protein